jgi:hypothetical protein
VKPHTARFALLVLFVGLPAVGPARADDRSPAPSPAKGGYGTGPSSPPPAVAPTAPARYVAKVSDWMRAAEARRAAAIDEINARGAAAAQAWTGIGERIFARGRELMQKAGFSAADIMRYDPAPKGLPENFDDIIKRFYIDRVDMLRKADLKGIGNLPQYAGEPEMLYPEGNQAAVAAVLGEMDEAMNVFRFYDEVLQKEFADRSELKAQTRCDLADTRRYEQQQDDIARKYHTLRGPPARAEMRALKDHYKHEHGKYGMAFDVVHAVPDVDFFAGFRRLLAQQDAPLIKRTDGRVSMVNSARKIDAQIVSVAEHLEALCNHNYDLFNHWSRSHQGYWGESIHGFYSQQKMVIGHTLQSWFDRDGATQKDLDRIGAEVKEMDLVEPHFRAVIDQMVNYEQQATALSNSLEDVDDQIYVIDVEIEKVTQPGHIDLQAWDMLKAKKEPIVKHEKLLQSAYDQVVKQWEQYEAQDRAEMKAMKDIEPSPTGGVTDIRIDVPDEDEPAKSSVATYPLKGAPVNLSVKRHFTDVTLGVPVVVRVQWEQYKDDPPAQLALNLVIGGKPVALTVYQDAVGEWYHSARLIFQQPSAAPAGAPAVQP